MRLYDPQLTPEQRQSRQEFGEWQLRLGDGDLPVDNASNIEIPAIFQHRGNLDSFIQSIYTNLAHRASQFAANPQASVDEYITYLQQRCILAPLNLSVSALNSKINDMLPGNTITLLSEDGIQDSLLGANADAPTELLHTIELSSWPPHLLNLKTGSVAIVVRNISPFLHNGTCIVIQRLQQYCIKATIITGPHKGTEVLIPRIKFVDNNHESGLPQIMYRKQFPIRLCWAMTINKAQGQSLAKAWIYLDNQCFSHSQLYVAFSRAIAPENIKVLTTKVDQEGRKLATNVVWRELLIHEQQQLPPLVPAQ